MMKKTLLFLIMTTALVWSKGQVYHAGDLYTAEDGSQGIVYYVFPDGSGWAVSLHDLPMEYKWGDQLFDIPNLPNYGGNDTVPYLYYPLHALADTAGYSNTMAILNSPQSVQTAASGTSNDLNGWYLPSAGQLSMLFAQLPLIETPLVDAGGTPFNNGLGISYWSSTEKDASTAWTVNFSLPMPSSENQFIYSFSGELVPKNKTTTHNVRAVRSIPAPSNYYDTTLTYLWNTGDTEPHFQVTPEQTTDYSVTVTNAYGCTNTASANVMVFDNNPQMIYDTVCQGSTYNNNGFTLSSQETAEVGEIVLTHTVFYANCESEIVLFLTVMPNDTVYLEQTATVSFVWNGVTYTEEGTYTQHFNNQNGCDSTVILTLTLDDGVYPGPDTTAFGERDTLIIYLPNAITPTRNDGLNDYFCLPEAYRPLISLFEIKIYNRWGTLVYHATDKNFQWDGRINGKIYFNNVYNYVIFCEDIIGRPYILRGTLTVL